MDSFLILILFSVFSLLIDLYIKNEKIKNLLDIFLVSTVMIISKINIFICLPIFLVCFLGILIADKKIVLLKVLAFIIIINENHLSGFYKYLLIMALYFLPLALRYIKTKEKYILSVDLIHQVSFFTIGVWLLEMNISSIYYLNVQLPLGLIFIIVSLAKSFGVLSSMSVFNSNDKLFGIENISYFLINCFYVPVFILDVAREYIIQLSYQDKLILSYLCTSLIFVSLVKHFYEIKFNHRKINLIKMTIKYFMAVFVFAAVFLQDWSMMTILLTLNYLLLIYFIAYLSDLFSGLNKVEPILIVLLFPTPLSLTLYSGVKIFRELNLANFQLMGLTLILIIIFSFLLNVSVIGNKANKYGKIPN